jgi:hypothetical protein
LRHSIVRATVFAVLAGGAGLAIANSTGPPASRTSAWAFPGKAAESNCTLCHSGSPLNDPSGGLQILDLPATYTPNQVIPVRVRLSHAWNPLPDNPVRWGFELQAIQASTGDSAGIWVHANVPPDTFKLQRGTLTAFRKRSYISHTRNMFHPKDPNGSTRYDQPSPVEWVIPWQAPAGDSGKIYFFAAGNSANGDGVSVGSGDFIFTTAESISGMTNVDVPFRPDLSPLRTELAPPYPNPMTKCTDLSFSIAKGGLVDLSVYDLQGRKVRTVLHEFREAGPHGTYWDGRGDDRMFAKNGVYLVRLRAPDGRKASQKIVLAR